MDAHSPEVERLVQRVQAGCGDATRELTRRYEPLIVSEILKYWNPPLRSVFDVDDLVQMTWCEFFLCLRQGTLREPGALAAFQAALARNVTLEVVRRNLQRPTYALGRSQSLDALDAATKELLFDQTTPAPADMAVAREALETLRRDLPPRSQRILKLRLQEHTHEEIAQELEVSVRTVERFFHKLAEEFLPPPPKG